MKIREYGDSSGFYFLPLHSPVKRDETLNFIDPQNAKPARGRRNVDIDDSNDLFDWASRVPPNVKTLEKQSRATYPYDSMMLNELELERMSRPSMGIFLPLLIFGIAMAYFESVAVVYLREIFGITSLFPVTFGPENAEMARWLRIEYGREVATLLMLASISIAVGRNAWHRMACFLFLFAVWDIFYYFWLWALIGWPSSLLTWDILFFVPYTLVAPIYAPIAVSAVMIFCSLMIVHAQKKQVTLQSGLRFWIMEILAFSLIYLSFIWEANKANSRAMENELSYPWLPFIIGLTIGLTAFLFLIGNCFKMKRYDYDLFVGIKF